MQQSDVLLERLESLYIVSSIIHEEIIKIAIPGIPNAHSHAFQYAMSGIAENHAFNASSDFWSWRNAMYSLALSIDPDDMQNIATMLYSEMLNNGYTSVAEFHYLHHDKKGNKYDNISEMGERILMAAQEVGMELTLVPIYYNQGNFNEKVIPELIKTLQSEKRNSDAEKIKSEWEKKVKYFIYDHDFPFGSEMFFDATAFESTHAIAKYAINNKLKPDKNLWQDPNSKEWYSHPKIDYDDIKVFMDRQIQGNIA